jgi:hypothetical protein
MFNVKSSNKLYKVPGFTLNGALRIMYFMHGLTTKEIELIGVN